MQETNKMRKLSPPLPPSLSLSNNLNRLNFNPKDRGKRAANLETMEIGEQQGRRNSKYWVGFEGSRQIRSQISLLASAPDRMDSDLLISRLAAAKRQFTLQQHHQSSQLGRFEAADRLSNDVFEAEEEEVRQDFPCPYCYEDHDIGSLCYHLEDEHPFESKVGICPICSVKVARDMLNHITLQHGYLFKLQRRRTLRRAAPPNSRTLSLLSRELREAQLQVLFGSGGYRSSNTNASTALTESLLSSLLLHFPTSESEEIAKSSISSVEDITNNKSTPLRSWESSCDLSLSSEEREQRRRDATVRATFVQGLLLSTLFND